MMWRAPITGNKHVAMSFADGFLTEGLEPLRHRLLFHPLWTGIEEGTMSRGTLRLVALQDW